MKRIFVLIGLLVCTCAVTLVFACEEISSDINSNIVRLHILANSDTVFDQELKLKVRDRLLNEASNRPDLLSDDQILSICRDEIKQSGTLYAVKVERGKFYFPQKQYDSISLPAGTYNAVRIKIGSGQGENWWCVMYPPLCYGADGQITDSTTAETLQKKLHPASYAIICEGDSITIKPGFKLVELWQKFKAKL